MLPTKWFNFREGPQGHPFPYCEIDQRWNAYITNIKDLVHNNNLRFTLSRCLLVISDDAAPPANGTFEPFKKKAELQEHLNYYILVPIEEALDGRHAPAWQRIGPVNCQEPNIQNMIQSDDKLKSIYAKSRSAYLIVPTDSPPSLHHSLTGSHVWRRVGNAFINMFHSNPREQNALYYPLTYDDWERYFAGDPSNRIPEDYFLIGFENAQNAARKWIFCLAADVDERLDKISLEFVTPTLNHKRFQQIIDFTRQLINTSQPLTKLIEHR